MNSETKLEALIADAPWVGEEPLKKRLAAVLQHEPDLVKARARIIRIADEVNEALSPVAACRQGCSHCCHQGLAIFEHEAALLAEASGRKMVAQPWRLQREVDDDIASSMGKPCPFLADNACSVYKYRPLACRLRHSLSSDPDDCSVDGQTSGKFLALDTAAAFIDPYVEVSCKTIGVEPFGSIHQYFPAPP